VTVASRLWNAEPGAKAVLRRALAEAACALPKSKGELAVVLTDDAGIRMLNRVWRNKDSPTNVLSFPARAMPAASGGSRAGAVAARSRRPPRLLGDIVLAYETVEREARVEHKPLGHHVAHLAVHGFLHLLGYDHEAQHEAEEMQELESAILARLDVPDPYAGEEAGS
jgi:probable rRNA maturation factor